MAVGIGLMACVLSWIVGVVIVDIKKTIKHNLITFYATLVKLSNDVSDCSLCYIKMYGNMTILPP